MPYMAVVVVVAISFKFRVWFRFDTSLVLLVVQFRFGYWFIFGSTQFKCGSTGSAGQQ
ncbi:hypothetical protein Hanom_Chr00s000188g01627741 [Helianthus anomalus]